MKNKILLKRRTLLEGYPSESSSYFAAKLLNTFGVTVDKVEKLNDVHVKLISDFYGINIPKSFYSNPQDLNYFTCSELILEQLVSYLVIAGNEHSDDKELFNRIELFKKVLPNYEEGKEVVLREYKIVSKQEAEEILVEYAENLAEYTRPWSLTETDEFIWLYENAYYQGQKIKSKDNTVTMFEKYVNPVFAKSLDQKDVVKLSISMKGEPKKLSFNEDEINKLTIAIANCYKTKLTKKQAKFFNTLRKHLKVDVAQVDHSDSPLKLAVEFVNENKIIEAAKVLSKNGSLLERNLKWLLSRANPLEQIEIMKLVKVSNPIVSIQLMQGLTAEENGARTFTFYAKNKVRTHIETEAETRNRKSILSEGTKKFISEIFLEKVKDYYRSLPSLGKVYISDTFKKIALPLNTSASGSGLDVIPVGSRLSIKGDYIRTFTYWNNVFDIDTSVSFLHPTKGIEEMYYGNFSTKLFGSSALASGDNRAKDGSEYIDFKLSELKELGYTHAVYSLNGFGGTLNEGEIFTGYQNKDNLDTTTWSPKNIEMKIQVKGNSRAFMAFAIDLDTNEIVILNQMLESNSRTIDKDDFKSIERYLDGSYLDIFNVAEIASLRGEVVDLPEDADTVFSNDYKQTNTEKKQLIISTFDVDKLVKLLN